MERELTKVLVDKEWAKIDLEDSTERENVIWSCLSSPPFPLDWPPVPRSRFRYYIYTVGNDISGNLRDGCHVAAPWALVDLSDEEELDPEIIIVSNELEDIGIQGVEPLSQREQKVCERAKDIQRYLCSLQALPEESSEEIRNLREYYSNWSRNNVALETKIKPHHKRFFEWLSNR
jgi:hypothetical protein